MVKKIKRTIAVVTSSRADYRYVFWVMKHLKTDRHVNLQVIVTGMHLSSEFGNTFQELIKDGFSIDQKVEMLIPSSTYAGMAESTGRGITGFAKVFEKNRPDIIVLTGDRFEMLSVAIAAMLMRIPIAHIGGGEITEGAVDDPIRHSITKMSHIHFCSHDRARDVVLQMGEKPSMVFSFGSPGLEDFHKIKSLTKKQFCKELGLRPDKKIILITYHPVTLSNKTDSSIKVFRNILTAIEGYEENIVLTGVNADLDGRKINSAAREFVKKRKNAYFITNLGRVNYISMLKHANVMIGNSSSGICEAPTFKLPVVNIGDRQKGRLRGSNVIDTSNEVKSIIKGIQTAQSSDFKLSLTDKGNPYYKGEVIEKIVGILKNTSLSYYTLQKRFVNFSRK